MKNPLPPPASGMDSPEQAGIGQPRPTGSVTSSSTCSYSLRISGQNASARIELTLQGCIPTCVPSLEELGHASAARPGP